MRRECSAMSGVTPSLCPPPSSPSRLVWMSSYPMQTMECPSSSAQLRHVYGHGDARPDVPVQKPAEQDVLGRSAPRVTEEPTESML